MFESQNISFISPVTLIGSIFVFIYTLIATFSPHLIYDLTKWWSEYWGNDFEITVKSKEKWIHSVRFGGIVMLIILVFFLGIFFYVSSSINFYDKQAQSIFKNQHTNVKNNYIDTRKAEWILKIIAWGAEYYASENEGDYIIDESQINYPLAMLKVGGHEMPSDIIDYPYCGKSYYGYAYQCSFNKNSYEIIAEPVNGRDSGPVFRIITGGVLSEVN